ncbi:NfeD family protein [Romboutsia sp. 1001713B170207_170306_H8]|uniref:NfeD family protein n=1 Tax=Romboutsia sp. 1001713B170207_170306_H8 TaxID=2787112 RepID=UPI001FAC131B|nr:NfeD family protein [Romboutsia sp. 1001713B170207_170306_H8]
MRLKLIWLAVAIIFGVGELLTTSLTLIWFSIGALVVLALSKIVTNIVVQLLIFAVISISLLVLATKKIVKNDKNHKYETNLQGILSKKGVVKEEILPYKTGIVSIDGEDWSAIGINNEKIEPGSTVDIVKIEGVKLIVKLSVNE